MRRFDHFKLKTIFSLFLMLFNCLQNLYAQPRPAAEFQIKAAFIYNFTRFIEWPPSAFSSANAPFVIGIIGNDPFGEYIGQLVKHEYVNDHPIVVRRYNQVKDITNCHVLFINTPVKKTREILQIARSRSILTISDDDDFTRLGGIVSFYKDDNKVRFKINRASSKTAHLQISSKLLNLATISGEQGNNGF